MRENPDVIVGYHAWAKPVVQLMRKSPRFTRVFYKALAEPWAREMSVREGLNGFGTVRGKVLMTLGLPICRLVGRMMRAFGDEDRSATPISSI